MGWTSIHAENYYKSGAINRKKECDTLLSENKLNRLKSAMVGGTYYAAVEDKTGRVFAVVILTHCSGKEYFNFCYKLMDESYGPVESDCPDSILNLLSNTEEEYSLNWRTRCRKRNKDRKGLKSLSIGSQICIHTDGKSILRKSILPGFSTPMWLGTNGNRLVRYKENLIIDYGFSIL